MKYKVDVVRIRENSITLNGWALGKTPESKVTFRVEDEHDQPVKCKMAVMADRQRSNIMKN